MIDAFIKKRGVTLCPPSGSAELAAIHIERQRAYDQQRVRGWRAPQWRKRGVV